MIQLPITSIIAAILAILMFPLTWQVSMRRAGLGKEMGDMAGVAYGDGNDDLLRRRIRTFGNFVEYVPICLIMIALIEMQGATAKWLWPIGIALIAGRLIHAFGMLYTNSPLPRAIGMTATYVGFLGPAIWLIINVLK